jgi:hypothetical protein
MGSTESPPASAGRGNYARRAGFSETTFGTAAGESAMTRAILFWLVLFLVAGMLAS